MEDLQSAKEMQALTKPFLDRGFVFEYTYEKGGDSSCVYIYRYRKGRNYFDLREVSGGAEMTFVVWANGEYRFPSIKALFPKAYRVFKRKHFFKRATRSETRAFVTGQLNEYLENHPEEFFGIKL